MKTKYLFPTFFLLIILQITGYTQSSVTYDMELVPSSPQPTPTPSKKLIAKNKKNARAEESSQKDSKNVLLEKTDSNIPIKKESEDVSTTEVDFNYTQENLTNNFGTWRTSSINFIHKFNQRKVIYGSYSEVSRFNKNDRQGLIGFYQPLNKKWTLLIEGDVSPTHRVLRKWSFLGQTEFNFRKGWIAKAGYRRSAYNNANANIVNFGAEKYWGNNRAAYTLSINHLENAGTSPSHRFQYNRYYGSQISNIGVSYAFGRELENLGNLGTLQTDVKNLTISGRHWFTKKWGVNYGFILHRQGNLYTRRGLNLGIRYRF